MIAGLKPYAGYKDSGQDWLGGVPKHWTLAPGHSAFCARKESNRGLKEKTVLSLSYGRIKIKSTDKPMGLVPESYETYQVVEPGNIIIRGTDLQNDKTSLRIALARNRGIISSAYLCLEARDTVIPDYGYQILNIFDLTKAIYRYGSGMRQNLDHAEIKRLPIFLPPIDEQAAIVRFLEHANRKIDGFIRTKRKLIALLNEQKQAIIHRAVTRGLDPAVPLKRSGIDWVGSIPSSWETRRIKQVARILRGKFSHRPRNDSSLYDGLYPFLQTGSIARAQKFVTSYSQTLNEKGLAVSKLFPRGTLCMTIAANIGDVAILDFDACFPDSIVGFSPSERIERDYLYLVFKCMKQELLRDAPVNTQGNLNVERLGKALIPLPGIDEQRAIIRQVEIDALPTSSAIQRIEREIALMQEYRTRLSADIVTGKLDVRTAAANLPEIVDAAADEAAINETTDELEFEDTE